MSAVFFENQMELDRLGWDYCYNYETGFIRDHTLEELAEPKEREDRPGN